jgi:hypothetical protein
VKATIEQKFGSLTSEKSRKEIEESFQRNDKGDGFPLISMRNVNRHFPPVLHKWSSSSERTRKIIKNEDLVEPSFANPRKTTESLEKVLLGRTKLYHHDLLQSFSFHLFAKRPIEPITTYSSLKRELMKRLILTALQIRLNVLQR